MESMVSGCAEGMAGSWIAAAEQVGSGLLTVVSGHEGVSASHVGGTS